MFFYSADQKEPRHVHVEREANSAKRWLDPVRLASSSGFGSVELTRIQALVTEHLETLRKAWDDYFAR